MLRVPESGHGFMIVKIPVEADGRVTLQDYLVDPSFRQFLTTQELQTEKSWADRLRGTEGGKQIVEELTHRGFVRASDGVADAYLGAHPARGNRKETAAELLRTSNPLISWGECEKFLPEVDLRTPAMELEGVAPRSRVRSRMRIAWARSCAAARVVRFFTDAMRCA
jgi:hypothetical protein